MIHLSLIALGILVMACMATPDSKVNKSIHVPNGETRNSNLSTVNGSISVGAKATVKGDCSTVNGRIEIGKGANVGEVSSVNGSIAIGKDARTGEVSVVNGSITIESESKVEGDVGTVNGSITCSAGVQISRDCGTVNGGIELDNARVREDVSTVNGDINLYNAAKIDGDIVINRERKGMSNKNMKDLTVRIDSDSIVKGNIEVKGKDPMVTVILSNGGKVEGEVINAKLVRK